MYYVVTKNELQIIAGPLSKKVAENVKDKLQVRVIGCQLIICRGPGLPVKEETNVVETAHDPE